MNCAESNGGYRDAPYDNRESMKVQCNKCGEVYSADQLGLHFKMAHGSDASNMEDAEMTASSEHNPGAKGQRRRRGKKEEKNVAEDQLVQGFAKIDLSYQTNEEILRCCVCGVESNPQQMEQHFNMDHYGYEVRVERVKNSSEAVNGKPRQANKRKSKKGGSKADADLMEICKVCHRKYEKKFAAMHYKLMHSDIPLDDGLEASPRMRLGQRKTMNNAPKSEEENNASEENQMASEPRPVETTTIKKVRRNNRKKMAGQGKSLEMCSVCQHHYLIPFASFHYKIMHPEISFTEEIIKVDDDMADEPRQHYDKDWKEGEEGSQQLVKGRLSKKKKRKKLAPGASDAFEICTLCDKKYNKQFAALHFQMMHGGSEAAEPVVDDGHCLDNGDACDTNDTPAPASDMVQCGICDVYVKVDELKMHYANAHHKRM